MSTRELSYFMQKERDEIISVPAPKTFCPDGEQDPPNLLIKILSYEKIQEVLNAYKRRVMVTSPQGTPCLTPSGDAVFKTERDTPRAIRHIIAEALLYPDLKNPQIMDFYSVNDISDMPLKVFKKTADFNYVLKNVMDAQGLSAPSSPETLVQDAKN